MAGLRGIGLGVLSERNYRFFFAGHVTSKVGTSMTPVALTFAVLGTGGGAAEVGLVLMAETVPLVAFVLIGGVLGDRLPRKLVMISADVARCASQATLAVLLLTGRPHQWEFMTLAAVLGLGEGFFLPSLTGLIPEITSAERLQDANALRSVGVSGARIAGPALAGVIVAATNPGWAIAADAISYGVSVGCLAFLPSSVVARGGEQSFVRALRQGWGEFWSRRWLWVIVAQFTFLHVLVFAPFLVLGAVVAKEALGGAAAWGTILAAQGAGSVCGGLVMLRVRPARPLRLATIGTFGFAAPLVLLASQAPAGLVAVSAFAGGVGLGVFDTLWDTTLQREVPRAALARISSYDAFGSLVSLPVGYAIVGPVAGVIGVTATLWSAASWVVLTSAIVLCLPRVTQLRVTLAGARGGNGG